MGRQWGRALASEEKKEVKLIVKEIKEMAGVFYIVRQFYTVVQISRKARSVYILSAAKYDGRCAFIKEGQLLLEDFPLPQFSLKYTQRRGFSALFVFLQFSKIRHISAMHMQISPLLLSLMSVHLINLTEAFIPSPFPASLSLRKFPGEKNRFKGR